MYGMEFLILLFCFMIGGSSASKCYEIRCDDAPLNELERLNFILNETQVIRLCPPTLELFNCYSKIARYCFEIELEELAKSDDPFAVSASAKILEAKYLTIEVCDENSPLRKDYFDNVDCVSRMVDNASTICKEKAAELSIAFLRKFRNLRENQHVDYSERTCLEEVYLIPCLAEQLERSCGEVARRTYLTLLGKVKSSVRKDCNVPGSLNFKRSFLEYLELEEKLSEIYRYAFETF